MLVCEGLRVGVGGGRTTLHVSTAAQPLPDLLTWFLVIDQEVSPVLRLLFVHVTKLLIVSFRSIHSFPGDWHVKILDVLRVIFNSLSALLLLHLILNQLLLGLHLLLFDLLV